MNDLPRRKPTRLSQYDYSQNGAVFITICMYNRKNILSTITKKPISNECILTLSEEGKIVEFYLNNLSVQYPEFSVDNYVIMPDHIHLILTKDNTSPSEITTSQVVAWLKYKITTDINNKNNSRGKKIFQRSFYDHIINDEKDYMKHWNYIYENPFRWTDELYLVYASN